MKDGETGTILVWERRDWVRFGRETGRWITCGRESKAAWQVTRWEECGRCGRLWEEKVAGFPKDIALPCVAIATRNSLRAHIFPAALPAGCLGVSLWEVLGIFGSHYFCRNGVGKTWHSAVGFMVLDLQSAALHVHVNHEDVAPGGAPQVLIYSDTGYLEHLILLAVFSWREQALLYHFKNHWKQLGN